MIQGAKIGETVVVESGYYGGRFGEITRAVTTPQFVVLLTICLDDGCEIVRTAEQVARWKEFRDPGDRDPR